MLHTTLDGTQPDMQDRMCVGTLIAPLGSVCVSEDCETTLNS
jgi:hypothetical protein